MPEVFVADIGTSFQATVRDGPNATDDPLDVSGASTRQMIFEKPDTTTVTKTAEFVTDGSDGLVEYVTESGFLDQPGWWHVQGFVADGVGEWHTTKYRFRVRANLA